MAYRHVIALMIFSATFAAYISRINLTVAIVHMSTTVHKSHIIYSDVCPEPKAQPGNVSTSFSSNSQPIQKRYDWDETAQGQILSSFYYFYLTLQIPGGRLIDRFGPQKLCSIALLGTGALSLLTPSLVDYFYLFIGSRMLMGAIQATIFSSCYALVSKWTPTTERSTVISLTSIGSAFGSMVTSSLTGALCAHHSWEAVFYASGGAITAIGLLYTCLVTDDPRASSFTSKREVEYIRSNLPGGKLKRAGSRNATFPWIKVLRSKPLLAVVFVKLTMSLVYNLVMLKLPSYLSQVLRLPIDDVGYYSALIYGTKGLSHFIFGLTADTLLRRQYFSSKTSLRKVFETAATFGTAIFFLLVSSTDCNAPSFITTILLAMICYGMQAGGEMSVYADLTNTYTATIFAIAQTISLIAGLLPHAMGPILDYNASYIKHTWWEIFNVMAVFNVAGGVVFLVWGSAEEQHWEAVDGTVVVEADCESKLELLRNGDKFTD